VDVRKADRSAARYLAKYLGKEMLAEAHRNIRGCSTSQSISLMKLVKRAQADDGIRYKFYKVEESDARWILGRYIHSNILDRKNFITGFTATRQLGGSEETSMLHNVSKREVATGSLDHGHDGSVRALHPRASASRSADGFFWCSKKRKCRRIEKTARKSASEWSGSGH
jgi:hypothetical protein